MGLLQSPLTRVQTGPRCVGAAPTECVILSSQVERHNFATTLGRTSVTLQDSPNAVTIRAVSESGEFLVLADTFYPGWQATLDGEAAEILRANYAFRAVALAPGEHTIVFRYAPPSFTVGAAISLAALIIVIGILVVLSLRRAVR